MPAFTELSSFSLGLEGGPFQGVYLLFLLCDVIVLALCPHIPSETDVLFKLRAVCSVLPFSKVYDL